MMVLLLWPLLRMTAQHGHHHRRFLRAPLHGRPPPKKKEWNNAGFGLLLDAFVLGGFCDWLL
jgi:hypothetical protein